MPQTPLIFIDACGIETIRVESVAVPIDPVIVIGMFRIADSLEEGVEARAAAFKDDLTILSSICGGRIRRRGYSILIRATHVSDHRNLADRLHGVELRSG